MERAKQGYSEYDIASSLIISGISIEAVSRDVVKNDWESLVGLLKPAQFTRRKVLRLNYVWNLKHPVPSFIE